MEEWLGAVGGNITTEQWIYSARREALHPVVDPLMPLMGTHREVPIQWSQDGPGKTQCHEFEKVASGVGDRNQRETRHSRKET